ncbi:MAG: GNAT family N-acetyltransferase [Actinobacteria bacterium]|nr:GNAT family N-acetyltransferase [Actinomycetota bacterium]
MIIRPAEPADAEEVAAVHVRSWQVGYRGLMPDDYLDGLDPAERAATYTFGEIAPGGRQTIVAVNAGSIVGFATIAPGRDDDLADLGELCALYVDPSHWGAGYGRELIAAARAALTGGGFTDAFLWVLVGNERAERFYRADGWTADGARKTAEVWGISVEEVRYRRPLP